jgi:hypothetical protein
MVDCIRKTVKSEGPLGLYKGVGSPLAGLAIINAVLFVTYGNSKHFVKNNITIGSHSSRTDPRDPTQMSIAQYFLTGSIVGGKLNKYINHINNNNNPINNCTN